MAKTIILYNVLTNSDNVEGKGHSIVVASFTDRQSAITVNDDPRFFKKYGVMGTKQNSEFNVVKQVINVFDSPEDFFSYSKDDLKKRALGKLTDEEKEALGLLK